MLSHKPLKPCGAYFSIRDTIFPMHVCRTKNAACLKLSPDCPACDTSIFGKYASRPTACLLPQFVFMTCKVIGHADLAAKPVSPPSHDKFMSAGTPPLGIEFWAARINKPNWTIHPAVFALAITTLSHSPIISSTDVATQTPGPSTWR